MLLLFCVCVSLTGVLGQIQPVTQPTVMHPRPQTNQPPAVPGIPQPRRLPPTRVSGSPRALHPPRGPPGMSMGQQRQLNVWSQSRTQRGPPMGQWGQPPLGQQPIQTRVNLSDPLSCATPCNVNSFSPQSVCNADFVAHVDVHQVGRLTHPSWAGQTYYVVAVEEIIKDSPNFQMARQFNPDEFIVSSPMGRCGANMMPQAQYLIHGTVRSIWHGPPANKIEYRPTVTVCQMQLWDMLPSTLQNMYGNMHNHPGQCQMMAAAGVAGVRGAGLAGMGGAHWWQTQFGK